LSFLLFFSSRRRHTRLPRDWSSDVCSSDLIGRDLRARRGRVVCCLLRLTAGPPILFLCSPSCDRHPGKTDVRDLCGALRCVLFEIGRASCMERVLSFVLS